MGKRTPGANSAKGTVIAAPTYKIQEILKGSDYGLSIFTSDEITALHLYDRRGKPYIRCAASDKERPAKPEEIVRQLYLSRLINEYGYPKERLAVEKPVYFGSAVHEKAADIVEGMRSSRDLGSKIAMRKPHIDDCQVRLVTLCEGDCFLNSSRNSTDLIAGFDEHQLDHVRHY